MGGAEKLVTFRVEAPGAIEASAAFQALSRSQDQASVASAKNVVSFKAAGEAMKLAGNAANDNARKMETFAQGAQRLTPAFGALGAAISRVSPEFAQLASAVGRAGGAMSGMTAIIGGAGGLAAGTLVAGLGMLATYLSNTKSQAEQLADQLQRVNDISAQLAAYDKMQGKGKRAAQGRQAFGLRDANGNLIDDGGEYAKWQAAQKAELERGDRYESSMGGPDEPGKPGKRPGFERPKFSAIDSQLDSLNRLDKRYDALAEDRDRPAATPQKNKYQAELEKFKSNAEQETEIRKQQAKEFEKLDADTTKRYEKMRDAGKEAFTTVGKAGIQALAGLAAGQKITLKDILFSVGSELVAKGTTWLFEGDARVAESYGLDPSGYSMNLIGAGAIAAGVAMMAGGTALGSGGRGGGGGGSRVRPAEPTMSNSRVAGSNTTTVNVHMPTVVSPTAQDGMRVQQALDEADRQGVGRRAA